MPLKELQCPNARRSNCWRKSVAGIAHVLIELESSRDAASLSHAEWLSILPITRRPAAIVCALPSASSCPATPPCRPEDVDYRAARGLDGQLFDRLLKGDWIAAHELFGHQSGQPASGRVGWLAPAATRFAVRSVLSPQNDGLFRTSDCQSLSGC
ncbi:hypothetical protein [Bradyrhizobium sp. 150]|uniref:hypothetical protein n=1 Tax=Bradyrhizobium sp. 150 TaxID=2782625 RepID=UPI0023DF2D06|nr:hypothetical protein [Bradyrhizobium sp. 150]MCK1676399.1 hypothetical protein [Bradyrhizobium sp. 150]